MSAENILKQNAEGADIAYHLFGSFTRGLDGTYRVTRSALSALLRKHKFDSAADWVDDVDYVGATNEVASRRGKPIAKQVARRTVDPSGRDVMITVRPITAAEGATAWEVVRGVKSATEECGTENDHIGARVVANGTGIYAMPPHPRDGGKGAQDDACMEVASKIVQEAFDSVGYVTSTVVSKALSRCYQQSGTYSHFLCEGARMGLANRPGTDSLIALFGDIEAELSNGMFGILPKHHGVPKNPKSDREWGLALLQTLADDAAGLAKKLRTEAASGKTRASTLETRRQEAQALLDQIREHTVALGEWGDVLKRQADAIHDSYAKACSGMTLDLPDCFDDLTPEAQAEARNPDSGAPQGTPPSDDDNGEGQGAPAPSTDPDLSAFDI